MNTVVKTNAQKEKSIIKQNLLLTIIGAVVIVFVLTIPILNKVATAAETKANMQRAFAADAARYTAMADFYLDETRVESLRYQALANLYTDVQRAFEADAARYTALAASYANNHKAETLRYQGLADLYTNTQQALEADTARYTAMADFFLAKNGIEMTPAHKAEAARYQGLAKVNLN